MGKFGLSGLTQSMARELQPQNIHVAQIVIDGGIASPRRDAGREPDTWLSPDSIAETYLQLHRQHRSAWASHIELRPLGREVLIRGAAGPAQRARTCAAGAAC